MGERMHRCDFLRGKFWHTFLQYESRLLEISRYVMIDPKNNLTFSESFAELIISLGSSVDTFFRKMSDCPKGVETKEKAGIKKKSEKLNITDYREIFEPYFELSQNNLIVPFGLGGSQTITPFKEFNNGKSPQWWIECNNIKHNLYANIENANLINILNTLGALLLLNVFHRCSQDYLRFNGVYRNLNGVLSPEEFEDCFHITSKGTDGCKTKESKVYIETNVFVFEFRDFEY